MVKKQDKHQKHLVEAFVVLGVGLIMVMDNAGMMSGVLKNIVDTYFPWLVIIWGLKTAAQV